MILSAMGWGGRCDGGTAPPSHRAWQRSVKLSLGRCSALCAALWPPTRMPSTSVARRIGCGTMRLGLRRDLTVGRSPSAQRANALMLWIFLAVADAADCALDLDIPVSYPTVSHVRTGVGRTRAR